MTIHAVIAHAQTAIQTAVTKIQSAPEYPDDNAITVPTCIAMPQNIRVALEGGFTHIFFDLRIEVAIPRRDLKEDFRFLDDIPEAIAAVFTNDPTIGGTCQTFDGDITATLTIGTIDQIEVIGYVITVPSVKI